MPNKCMARATLTTSLCISLIIFVFMSSLSDLCTFSLASTHYQLNDPFLRPEDIDTTSPSAISNVPMKYRSQQLSYHFSKPYPFLIVQKKSQTSSSQPSSYIPKSMIHFHPTHRPFLPLCSTAPLSIPYIQKPQTSVVEKKNQGKIAFMQMTAHRAYYALALCA